MLQRGQLEARSSASLSVQTPVSCCPLNERVDFRSVYYSNHLDFSPKDCARMSAELKSNPCPAHWFTGARRVINNRWRLAVAPGPALALACCCVSVLRSLFFRVYFVLHFGAWVLGAMPYGGPYSYSCSFSFYMSMNMNMTCCGTSDHQKVHVKILPIASCRPPPRAIL